MQCKLLGVVRRGSSADDHLALDLFDHEIPDPAVGRLADSVFNPLRKARPQLQSIFGDALYHSGYT